MFKTLYNGTVTTIKLKIYRTLQTEQQKRRKKQSSSISKFTQFTLHKMSHQLSLIQKIQSQQSSTSIKNISVKLQKVKLFISNSKEKLPQITAEIQGKNKIAAIVKNYFRNEKEIMFFKNYSKPENYFTQKEFSQQIQLTFTEFLKDQPQYSGRKSEEKQFQSEQLEGENQSITKEMPEHILPKIDFLEFLQYWLKKESTINVFYEKYYDAVKNSVEKFEDKLYGTVSKNASKSTSEKQIQPQSKQRKSDADNKNQQNQKKDIKKPQNSPQKLKKNGERNSLKEEESKPSLAHLQQEEDNNQNYDQQQYQQQASELPSSNNHSASRQSTHSYTIPQNTTHAQNTSLAQPKDSFNYYLQKFYDHYCKKYLNTIKNQQFEKLEQFYNSMNLTKFMMYCKDVRLLKVDKKITAKFLQQHFKAEENQKHCLDYEAFAKIVRISLQIVFEKPDIIQTQGYEHIGVFNRQNFAQVMGRLGVNVPLKKIVFTKAQDMRSLSRMVKSRTKEQTLNLKHSKAMKDSHFMGGETTLGQGHGHESNWDSNKLHPDLFLNEKQRKQQRLLQCLTIPKLNKLQPSKHMDDKLHELVDEQYDPYLKRYNEKNKNSVHDNGSGHGMMKRIDQRIQNVVKKMR